MGDGSGEAVGAEAVPVVVVSGAAIPSAAGAAGAGGWSAALNVPGLAERMYEHIADGGNAIDLAKILGVRYSVFSKWVEASPERVALKAKAEKAREEWIVQRMIQMLTAISELDVRDAYNEWGTYKSIHEMSAAMAQSITKVKTFEEWGEAKDGSPKALTGKTLEVTFSDKLGAIKLLGTEMRMFLERRELTGRDGAPMVVVTGVPVAEPVEPAREDMELGKLLDGRRN